jgi:hypothetical protein
LRGSPCCRLRTRECPDRGSTRAAPAARRGAIRLCAHHMCCTWPQLFAGSNEAHLIIDPFTIVLPTIVVRVRALTVALAVDPGPLMQHAACAARADGQPRAHALHASLWQSLTSRAGRHRPAQQRTSAGPKPLPRRFNRSNPGGMDAGKSRQALAGGRVAVSLPLALALSRTRACIDQRTSKTSLFAYCSRPWPCICPFSIAPEYIFPPPASLSPTRTTSPTQPHAQPPTTLRLLLTSRANPTVR